MLGSGTLAASYGQNVLQDNDSDDEITNSLISAGYYHQATKSLKVTVEVNFAKSDLTDVPDPNTSVAIAAGMLLLF
jgi:hypothetical protein